MDWTGIIVGVLTLIGALAGTYFSNRKAQALIAYRIEQLEKEVREHNNFARRMPVLEEQMKVANHRISDLEARK